MAWIYFLVASLFEIGYVMGLKFSEGFTRLWPTLGFVVSGGLSFSRTYEEPSRRRGF